MRGPWKRLEPRRGRRFLRRSRRRLRSRLAGQCRADLDVRGRHHRGGRRQCRQLRPLVAGRRHRQFLQRRRYGPRAAEHRRPDLCPRHARALGRRRRQYRQLRLRLACRRHRRFLRRRQHRPRLAGRPAIYTCSTSRTRWSAAGMSAISSPIGTSSGRATSPATATPTSCCRDTTGQIGLLMSGDVGFDNIGNFGASWRIRPGRFSATGTKASRCKIPTGKSCPRPQRQLGRRRGQSRLRHLLGHPSADRAGC